MPAMPAMPAAAMPTAGVPIIPIIPGMGTTIIPCIPIPIGGAPLPNIPIGPTKLGRGCCGICMPIIPDGKL